MSLVNPRSFKVFPCHVAVNGLCSCSAGANCKNSGKHPRIANNLDSATNDITQLGAWKRQFPGCNWGVPTGNRNGVFVLDIDHRNDGHRTLAKLEGEHGALPETYTVATGNGSHKYFTQPDFSVKSLAEALGQNFPGLDTRGDGGMVIAPGSRHFSGAVYNLVNEHEPVPAPTWLLNLLRTGRAKTREAKANCIIPSGTRDNALTSLAGTMRRRGASDETIIAALTAENKKCDPPLSDDDIHRIARSVSRYAPDPLADFRDTDTWAAERFADWAKDRAKYCHDLSEWRCWDGRRWAPDQDGAIHRLVKEFIRQLYLQAGSITDDDLRTRFTKFVVRCESRQKREAIVSLAEKETIVSAQSGQFDQDNWLLNVENGVIELKSGTLRAHRREDMISKLAPVTFDEYAQCPVFEKFLADIFNSNSEVIEFVREAVGYTLTGSITASVLFLLRGEGRNGKGTLLKTLERLLGEYATAVQFHVFMAKPHGDSGPRDGKKKMVGKRLVRSSEGEDGQRLAESKIKELVSPDGMVSAGVMYQDHDIDFKVTHKIWLATNHDPIIRGTDEAIWSRIVRIDFTRQFTGEADDTSLEIKLLAELPGILNWSLSGLARFLARGTGKLTPPKLIAETTNKYRNEQNQLKQFLEDACELDGPSRTQARVLYQTYKDWAKARFEYALTETKFGKEMPKLLRKMEERHVAYYCGVRLSSFQARIGDSVDGGAL